MKPKNTIAREQLHRLNRKRRGKPEPSGGGSTTLAERLAMPSKDRDEKLRLYRDQHLEEARRINGMLPIEMQVDIKPEVS